MEEQRLASLIDSFIAGVLNADEWMELHQRLAASPAARAQYERHIACHQLTHPNVCLPDAAELLRMKPAASGRASHEPSFASIEVVSGKLRAWCLAGAVAVCAGAGLLISLYYQPVPVALFQPPIANGESVAILRHAANVYWVNLTNEMFVGDPFPADRVQIAAGAIQVEFKRGARLVVEGPADLQLISDNEAFLHSGKVTAHVPERAHGFKVTAPALAVVDLGTEFGLRAPPNAAAELHVFSGTVEMAPMTKPPRRMMEGQAARIEGSRVRKTAVDRRAFLFEDEMAQREANEQRERLRAWKSAAQKLSSDPGTLVHYTFEDQRKGVSQLANTVSSAPAALPGTIVGSEWTEGRWPQKGAIAFTGQTDRIRFTVPNTLTSLTYMAWLRIDALLNSSNALAITESMQLGEVHWQVYRDGRVALSARSGASGTVDQTWDRGLSGAVFTAERLGKWTHLTSVYDASARTINHYVNGRFVSSSPIKRPVPLKLGAVEIGNWGVRVDQPKWASMKNAGTPYLSRFWNGRIDEFALLSRALTAEEIRQYYEQGRVAAGMVLAKAE
ncbi:MAG TPA: LamG-like jellyroll fold domain-containing protein [Methylomirabilota bacterium]|nr:LamG-like jellyroll fold domain-containing protein [Methylomirabilota bacterium]